MLPMFLIGLIVFWYTFRPIKITPALEELNFDTSNRVNRIWLLWLVMKRPWRFVVVLRFLQYDLAELAAMINDREGDK